jgi:hypothetical protein
MKKNIVQNTMALFLLAFFVGCGAPTYNVEKPLTSMEELGEGLDKDDRLALIMSVGMIQKKDKNWVNGKTAQEIITYGKELKNRIACIKNLKQIGIATRIYATDNQDRFPWQVASAEGGCAESMSNLKADPDGFNVKNGRPAIVAFPDAFSAMRNELFSPDVLICPSDESAVAANNFDSLTEKNISYKLGLQADESKPNRILSLCKHHHAKDGEWLILLSDSSVQRANNTKLQQYWTDQGISNLAELKLE